MITSLLNIMKMPNCSGLFMLLMALIASSCTHEKKFDKDRWLVNNDVNDTSNPRAYMTDDLFRNYLKRGMPKDSILALLGKPYIDSVVLRLPKNIRVPDSISIVSTENMEPGNRDVALKRYNNFIRANSQPDTLMLYPAGWSTIDPKFLVVKFDNVGKVNDYWIEQH